MNTAEIQRVFAFFIGLNIDTYDGGACGTKFRCNRGKCGTVIRDFQIQRNKEASFFGAVRLPRQRHPTLRSILTATSDMFAVGSVHRQTVTFAHEAPDIVARNRMATCCQLYRHAFSAANADRGFSSRMLRLFHLK